MAEAPKAIRVEILDGEDAGSVHLLSGISILGRDAVCSLRIAARTVSREHAMIRPEEGVGFVIEDLDSRSGTFVNGSRTRKAVLLDGDTFRIGPVSLRVKATSPVEGEVPIDEIQMVKSRHMPTARLSLDVVKFRTSARHLKESGSDLQALPLSPPPKPEGPDPFAAAADDTPAEQRLELLCEISNSLASIHQPSRLTRETAMRLFALFPQARRIGFFEIEDDLDTEERLLRPTYLVDRSQREKGNAVRISQRVLHSAVEQKQAILSEDVAGDPRFKVSQSLSEAGVCSILCAPMCLGERVLGALYLDTTDALRPFDEGALRLVTGVAAILAAAFQNTRLFARVQTESVRRASLERYFSPDLVERVLKGDLPLAREGRLARGTILFVDIRGFTRLTLTTEPTVLVATLNAYFSAMQRIIFRSHGTVERFGGDSILAYWGVVDEHDAQAPARAIRAALNMQVEIFRLNPELRAAKRPQLNVAVGVNTGDVIAGDVGSAERYEFTILGDAINMARRLESLAGAWEVIAGQATIEALGSSVLHQPLPPTLVKGKDTPVELSLVHGLRVDQGASPERHYDLAVPGQLDLSSSPAGSKPEQTLLSGLRMLRPDALSVEVLTLEDPVPGTLVRLSLRLPRAEKSLVVSGQVLPSATDETLLLGPNLAVSGSGVQRIPLRIQQPRELLAYLRLDPHA